MPRESGRVLKGVRAYRWWVAWDTRGVIVTAATKEDAVALVAGLGLFGRHVYRPHCKVVRATERHAAFFVDKVAAELEAARSRQMETVDTPLL